MKNKKLHISSPLLDVNIIFPNSILISDVNQELTNQEYHTSLGDLPFNDIMKISSMFDEIIFHRHKFDQNSHIYFETVLLLTLLSRKMPVTNFELTYPDTFTNIDVVSREPEPTLWVFGCSHSHGVGLTSVQQRYSSILQQYYNIPLKSITQPGSSTQWSFRHLMNANLRPGDTVVWQLTTPDRLTWADPIPSEIMLSATRNKRLVDLWDAPQLLFYQLSILNAGVQYLRSKSVKFVITSILSQRTLFYQYLMEYVKYPEFCYIPSWPLDLATDNQHVGPLSHRALAQALINHLQYNNE